MSLPHYCVDFICKCIELCIEGFLRSVALKLSCEDILCDQSFTGMESGRVLLLWVVACAVCAIQPVISEAAEFTVEENVEAAHGDETETMEDEEAEMNPLSVRYGIR